MKKSKPPSLEYHSIKGPKRTRLIQERKKKKLSQKELAKIIGCSEATISYLENGRMKPGLEISLSLQEIFDLNYEEIFPDL
ncbi:helix-turn-helix transcriptional regulator [Oceanobacillus aidingensis]|uniref:Helix-turn-helix transcriptional regulator n=1 Tax=Oceanobacillus aidingensis TaxID=645964 RepID=A0ABV9JVD9_9BACI